VSTRWVEGAAVRCLERRARSWGRQSHAAAHRAQTAAPSPPDAVAAELRHAAAGWGLAAREGGREGQPSGSRPVPCLGDPQPISPAPPRPTPTPRSPPPSCARCLGSAARRGRRSRRASPRPTPRSASDAACAISCPAPAGSFGPWLPPILALPFAALDDPPLTHRSATPPAAPPRLNAPRQPPDPGPWLRHALPPPRPRMLSPEALPLHTSSAHSGRGERVHPVNSCRKAPHQEGTAQQGHAGGSGAGREQATSGRARWREGAGRRGALARGGRRPGLATRGAADQHNRRPWVQGASRAGGDAVVAREKMSRQAGSTQGSQADQHRGHARGVGPIGAAVHGLCCQENAHQKE
jgi:hypothetical protein